MIPLRIGAGVLKDAVQDDIVKLFREFHVVEISDHNLQVRIILMPLVINQRPPLRQIHGSHTGKPAAENAGNGPRSGADLKSGRPFAEGIPGENILSYRRQMVKDRKGPVPVVAGILSCPHKTQDRILDVAIRILVPAAVITKIQIRHIPLSFLLPQAFPVFIRLMPVLQAGLSAPRPASFPPKTFSLLPDPARICCSGRKSRLYPGRIQPSWR